jgi:glycosyltransferase involved in cell wall biosynthesis
LKILVLSFYFQPDICAGSFRATALVNALRKEVPAGSQIDVVTTLPNRYKSFSVAAEQAENHDGLAIHRIALSAHQSGMMDQSMAFLAYSREVLNYVASRDYDIVCATSSRLMTAVLGAWIALRKRAQLYLDIRDIFADTIKDVLPKRLAWAVKPVFSVLERWTVNRADKVNLVSKGFSEYFAVRYPHQRFSFHTNGIDDEFLAAAPTNSSTVMKPSPIKVVYAGNIGEGQGLHSILPELAKRLKERVQFKVIGDGGRKEVLRKALELYAVDNVELLPPMQREELIEAYRTADVLFLHLNDYEAFKKVLPSKLFEYAAMGKPIWAGVPGYSAEFVKSEISNAAIFYPCNAAAAEQALGDLVFQDTPRTAFIEKYARANICRRMAEDIATMAEK